MLKVLVELESADPSTFTMDEAGAMAAAQVEGFYLDTEYEPVPLPSREVISEFVAEEAGAEAAAESQDTVLVRGEVEEERVDELRAQPNVVEVWTDARIAAFDDAGPEGFEDIGNLLADLGEEFAIESGADIETAFDLETASPCPPTDCAATTAKGTASDVAKYLRCDWLWGKGIRGDGVHIGICDSGVNKTKVPAFVGGWSPPSSSYVPGSAPASSHGTMCGFDASSMSPGSKIVDIAVLQSSAGGITGLLSDAIAAFQWAFNQYKANGNLSVLSNSWGMYQKSWAPDYATNANHPFTRKVAQVIAGGMIVLFAAGNCGSQCPSGKCGSDNGPGQSIWGANGHKDVITVGAANIREEWIGYTSQGPAALYPNKPDFCAPSHFKGARSCDNGTSAACPVCAGVVALLKSHDQNLTQAKVQEALSKSAKNLCAPGWDANSGHGMIQAQAAYRYLFEPGVRLAEAMWIHGTSVHEEFPDRIKQMRRLGPYALFEGKPGTSNWFHFAIPTPVIVDGRRLRLDSILFTLYADPDVWVTNVHIYDGHTKIEEYNGLSLTGTRWWERFDVLNRLVRRGIGVSIGVRFGTDESKRHYILFVSGGGDFIT